MDDRGALLVAIVLGSALGRLFSPKRKANIIRMTPAATKNRGYSVRCSESQNPPAARTFTASNAAHNAGRMRSQLRPRLRPYSDMAAQVSAENNPVRGVK